MWYSLRSMRALFYIGAMVSLVAMALIYWDNRVAGAIVLCFGIAMIMIGFLGIVVNFLVSNKVPVGRLR